MSRERKASRSDVVHCESLKYRQRGTDSAERKNALGTRQESFDTRRGFVFGFKIE